MKIRSAFALVLWLTASNASAAEPPAQVAGKWRVVWTVRQPQPTRVNLLLQLDQVGATLSGTVKILGEAGEADTEVHSLFGTLEGKTVLIVMSPIANDPNVRIEFRGRVEDDQMGGTTERGDPWSATRSQGLRR